MLTTEPPLATSFRLRGRADPHRSGEVDRDHLGEHLGIVLDVAADHAGRVHHHVEPRQAFDERSYRGVLAHVEAAKRDAAIRGVGVGRARTPHRSRRSRRRAAPRSRKASAAPSPMPLVPPVTSTPRPAKRPGAKLSTMPVIDPVFKARRIFHRGHPPEFLILRCSRRRASKDAALPVQRLTAGACFEARPSASHLSMRKVGRVHAFGPQAATLASPAQSKAMPWPGRSGASATPSSIFSGSAM